MSEITGEKITLKRLFSDEYFFNTPEYQRPYSWQDDNNNQLFDDIYESDRKSEYFLGTIILQEIEELGTGVMYDIIDGQQRLTTIQILLACLRDTVVNKNYKNSLQQKIYQKENPADGLPEVVRLKTREHIFFKEYVQKCGGTKTINSFEPQNDAQKNLKNAILIFNKNLKDIDQKNIESLIQHISQRCIFICVATKNFTDAYRLFTIINDRGLQLRRIDILKTNNLDPIVIPNPDERKSYSEKWESMEDDLGSENFENLISFIRTIEIKEKPKEDLLKEFNNLVFKKDKIKKGKEFIDYIMNYKNIYQKLILDRDLSTTFEFKNLLNIMIDFLPSTEWIPSLLYYYNKFKKDGLHEFLTKLEKKFVADWVVALTPTKRTVNLNSILKSIEKSNNYMDVLKSKAFDFDKELFINELKNDIYNKRYTRYILLKLEYLESEQTAERRYGTISVEHVLPQSPRKDSTWVKLFTDDERILFTNKLANLVLLSKKKNSSASNFDFQKKKENYLKNRATDLTRSQAILRYNTWTPDILIKRQTDIIKILSK
ncbi:DUF262 domain-containing protein [Clostridium tyrobutyricum]|uniref:DUF262 domain-containing protein n=1 Tax=Clostridium tyrobutyricum TaxID=1519 RepID=UPI0039F6BBAD